jgi:hypothetical protein
MLWTLLLSLSRWVGMHNFCFFVQTLFLLINCLGAFPGTIMVLVLWFLNLNYYLKTKKYLPLMCTSFGVRRKSQGLIEAFGKSQIGLCVCHVLIIPVRAGSRNGFLFSFWSAHLRIQCSLWLSYMQMDKESRRWQSCYQGHCTSSGQCFCCCWQLWCNRSPSHCGCC